MAKRARLADLDQDFENANLNRHEVALWEDGMRTDAAGENYEWWYFDANLADGSQLVITFYAKSVVDPSNGLKPMIDIDLTRPDGTKISHTMHFSPTEFTASDQRAEIKIAGNYFRGDLNHYVIHVQAEDITVMVDAHNIVPAWRRNVAIFFGDQDETNFGWLPATPREIADVTMTTQKGTEQLSGNCYHDHNWGNVALMKVMHHWYWGRANIDDYTVISSYMTAEKKYGYQTLPVFMLAKGDRILADDPKYLTYEESDRQIDDVTGKPYHKAVSYDYNDGKQHYRITYLWEQTITQDRMIDQVSGVKHVLAKLTGFDGAYLRFSGKVRLDIYQGETISETHESQGLWEEMYFGKTIN